MKLAALTNVRKFGNYYVLYRRGKVWVMPKLAEIDPAKDAAKVKVIQRFTKEYFDLVRANDRVQNEVLASQKEGEELLVKFRDTTYLVK